LGLNREKLAALRRTGGIAGLLPPHAAVNCFGFERLAALRYILQSE
jgi:hypothetical protein